MASNEENSYGNILRRITAFGGVQMFNILISLVRGKFVAVFLGPEGMGISSLYTSSTSTLQQFSSLGLNLALVKEVASAKDSPGTLHGVLVVAVRLIILTALLGTLLCILLSPLLSLWSFGSADYTAGFILASLSVGLSVAGAGYLSLLQGLGAVKRLAWASLIGGATGLFIGVPLYRFWGNAGIVPAIIAGALSTFLFYWLSYRRIAASPGLAAGSVRFSWAVHRPLVKRLLATGAVLMIGSLTGSAISYAINAFVRGYGSMEDVGLFQAANSLTNQYIGILISALALDYFPRLAAAAADRRGMNMVINRQLEIVSLVATPLVIALTLTAPLVIRIFLTSEFADIASLMRWMGLGALLQLTSFPIGYVFLVKDNRRLYFWLEVVMGNLLWLGCSLVCYWQFGLTGLGISMVVRALLGDPVCLICVYKVYGVRISRRVWLGIVLSWTLCATAFAASFSAAWGMAAMSALLLVSLGYSLTMLRRAIRRNDED